ncbi:MAG: hypothetical protein J2P53_03670 [Bradyrhizobiaceae bacterium]|nr:hypothetical protein [Bradyrhizobiaceae bacterium]
MALSDGTREPRHGFTKASEKRLRRLQRAMGVPRRGRRRRRKRVAALVAKCHKHLANQRRDHAHKVPAAPLTAIPVTGQNPGVRAFRERNRGRPVG